MSITTALTTCLGGWLSLGCKIWLLQCFKMTFNNLLFDVTLREPPGLARLNGTGPNGYSSAFAKSITCPLFAEADNNNPKMFPLTSTDFNFLSFSPETVCPVLLNRVNFFLDIGSWKWTFLVSSRSLQKVW